MAILRGEQLVFFRNRAADGEGGLADMVHQTAMYYEDRLSGAGFGRVVLAGGGRPGRPRAGRGLSPPRARTAARHAESTRSIRAGRDAGGSHHGEYELLDALARSSA